MAFDFTGATDSEILMEAFRRAEATPDIFSTTPAQGYEELVMIFQGATVSVYINSSQVGTLAPLVDHVTST